MERQEYLEQQVAAIASNDDNLIKDPNLKAELFTIPAYQTIIVQCKLVAEKKGTLAMEDILPALSKQGLDGLYIELMDLSYQKSRYDEMIAELQTSLSIRKAKEYIVEVENDAITFEEFQSSVSKLGNEYNLGTSSK